MRGLSLFANVGIAETYFKDIGIDIVVANELLEERANFYKHLYPDCNMICGDITNEKIYKEVVATATNEKVDFILATPPCQGMSLNGKKDPDDIRNSLVIYAINAINDIKPKFVLMENVPQQLKTKISFNGNIDFIPKVLEKELGNEYVIKYKVLNTKDYGICQSRSRCFTIMYRKDLSIEWEFPMPEEKILTLKETIGHLPSLEAFAREDGYKTYVDYENLHYPPVHARKHIEIMKHTPTGKSAFENEVYYPKKDNGERVSGGAYAYMRMSWDKPAPTVTQNNGVISSFTNVHPGRMLEDGTYSDARVLTIHELLLVTSLPTSWNIPRWASEKLIRSVIGEAIPPLMTLKILKEIRWNND